MSPARVLFPYVGDSVGGSHVSSLLLARALPISRYEPVVAVHENGPCTDYLKDLNITPLRAPTIPYIIEGGGLVQGARRAAAAYSLSRFLRNHDIGIVHTQDMRMHRAWGPGASRAGTAHVWHQRTPVRSKKHARAASKADALIAVSHFCAKSCPPVMRDAAEVVYNPFAVSDPPDRQAAKASLQSLLGLPADARFVLYIANFAPRKRPQVFVDLAAELAKDGKHNIHFLMIGTPHEPEGTAVKSAIAAAGLEGRCHVLGARHPIEPWLGGADLLIAPAVDEAFGRTLVEAQLQCVPVIASDAGGHREIIEHGVNGILVTPDEIATFAKEAQSLLDNEDYAMRMAKAARKDAEARFSISRHLESILAVYDRITHQD